MQTADIYEPLRPLLFSIAYRMLGTVSDAKVPKTYVGEL